MKRKFEETVPKASIPQDRITGNFSSRKEGELSTRYFYDSVTQAKAVPFSHDKYIKSSKEHVLDVLLNSKEIPFSLLHNFSSASLIVGVLNNVDLASCGVLEYVLSMSRLPTVCTSDEMTQYRNDLTALINHSNQKFSCSMCSADIHQNTGNKCPWYVYNQEMQGATFLCYLCMLPTRINQQNVHISTGKDCSFKGLWLILRYFSVYHSDVLMLSATYKKVLELINNACGDLKGREAHEIAWLWMLRSQSISEFRIPNGLEVFKNLF